jgi:hypothetical protein
MRAKAAAALETEGAMGRREVYERMTFHLACLRRLRTGVVERHPRWELCERRRDVLRMSENEIVIRRTVSRSAVNSKLARRHLHALEQRTRAKKNCSYPPYLNRTGNLEISAGSICSSPPHQSQLQSPALPLS